MGVAFGPLLSLRKERDARNRPAKLGRGRLCNAFA